VGWGRALALGRTGCRPAWGAGLHDPGQRQRRGRPGRRFRSRRSGGDGGAGWRWPDRSVRRGGVAGSRAPRGNGPSWTWVRWRQREGILHRHRAGERRCGRGLRGAGGGGGCRLRAHRGVGWGRGLRGAHPFRGGGLGRRLFLRAGGTGLGGRRRTDQVGCSQLVGRRRGRRGLLGSGHGKKGGRSRAPVGRCLEAGHGLGEPCESDCGETRTSRRGAAIGSLDAEQRPTVRPSQDRSWESVQIPNPVSRRPDSGRRDGEGDGPWFRRAGGTARSVRARGSGLDERRPGFWGPGALR
jgi:hypothetical protein